MTVLVMFIFLSDWTGTGTVIYVEVNKSCCHANHIIPMGKETEVPSLQSHRNKSVKTGVIWLALQHYLFTSTWHPNMISRLNIKKTCHCFLYFFSVKQHIICEIGSNMKINADKYLVRSTGHAFLQIQ